jgi:L-seryl-tRNA(Ser) seleniumtransferase
MPELMRSTGVRIVEIGTTNKTGLQDYARELRAGDLVLKVHPSNYRVEGFTEEVRLGELAALCRERDATLIFDAGSGCLYDFARFGLDGEMTVEESLAAGAHIVTFSGDKLLGGPQAGLIVGEADRVRRLAKHPMQRALRLDKLVLAALEVSLMAYARPGPRPELPLFDALALSDKELRRRGREMTQILNSGLPDGWSVEQAAAEGAVGGGAYAERPLPGRELRLRGPSEASVERLHARLRGGDPAILTRIQKGVLGIDLRSPEEDELAVVADRIIHLTREAEDIS